MIDGSRPHDPPISNSEGAAMTINPDELNEAIRVCSLVINNPDNQFKNAFRNQQRLLIHAAKAHAATLKNAPDGVGTCGVASSNLGGHRGAGGITPQDVFDLMSKDLSQPSLLKNVPTRSSDNCSEPAASPATVSLDRVQLERVIKILENSEDWIGNELFDDDERSNVHEYTTQEERAEFISEQWKQALAILQSAINEGER